MCFDLFSAMEKIRQKDLAAKNAMLKKTADKRPYRTANYDFLIFPLLKMSPPIFPEAVRAR